MSQVAETESQYVSNAEFKRFTDKRRTSAVRNFSMLPPTEHAAASDLDFFSKIGTKSQSHKVTKYSKR